MSEDWPQWRGLQRDGKSPETGLMKSWPDSGPERKWIYRNAGVGYSGPAIADGVLYAMGARSGTEFLFAVDAGNGREKWAVAIGRTFEESHGDGPRATPTVDGDYIFTMSSLGNLVCVRKKSGERVWGVSMESLGGRMPNWGFTESVLVDGDKVLCTPGGSKGAVAALDKATGNVLWRSEGFTDPAHYSSIIKATIHGVDQYIQRTDKSIAGVAAADGKVLWKTDFPGRVAAIPTPVQEGNHVYVTAGYGAGCKMVRIDPDFSVTEVYANKVMKSHHGGVVLVDGCIYGHSDGAGWTCQNFLTGKEIWSDKRSLGKGSVAYADGMLYCLYEGDGTVALVEASPEGYHEKSRFQLTPQSSLRSPSGGVWTHPVIANGNLYLRDQEIIYCFDIQAK